MAKTDSRDKIEFKEKKGTWKRFMHVLFHSHMPWFPVIAYIVAEVFFINMSVDETDLTAQLFSGDTSAALLMKLIGIMVLNLVLANMSVFLNNFATAQMDRNMRNVLTRKILKLPMSFFRDENPREAIYRVVSNSIVVSSTLMLVVIPIGLAFYKTILIFFKVFKYDWRLSLILLIFIPVQILIAFIFGRISFSLSEKESGIYAGLNHRLAEMITNIPLAKAFAKEDREAAEGEALVDRLYKIGIKGSWLSQFKDLSTTFVSLIQAALMTGVGAMLLANGGITTRKWVSFFMFSATFTGAVEEFLMYWNNLKTIQGGADRVAEIMSAEEENLSGREVDRLSGDLVISDLSFGYSEEKEVLSHVNACFPQGSKTALLGASGCGKTTLLNLIMRLYEPGGGSISADGVNIRDYALYDYRRQFVMVSQDEMLFSGTIFDNVAYGNENVTEESVKEALKKSGAYDFVSQMKKGIYSELSEYGENLSGGQKQRISLARAYLSKAPYLVLDEPAAALDVLAVRDLIECLKDIAEDRTLIVIGHTPSILPLVERAVIIEDKTVSAEGPIKELEKTSSFLAAFLRSDGEEDAKESAHGDKEVQSHES